MNKESAGIAGPLRIWCFFLSTRKKECEAPPSHLGAGWGWWGIQSVKVHEAVHL